VLFDDIPIEVCMYGPIAKHPQMRIATFGNLVSIHEFPDLNENIDDLPLRLNCLVQLSFELPYDLILHEGNPENGPLLRQPDKGACFSLGVSLIH
jgi:hypothetical protein